ncbi:uncharacterized protein LOC142976597 [Anticarsia gemmatalis]|uniref:uncharacterized protein LOC142976597 n=1 Tax=Anticarsia gemmatalis TaxID=129554 RepID=UPI003F762578
MLLPGKTSPKIWIILTVLISFIALSESFEDDGYSNERFRRSADEGSFEKVKKPSPKAESSDSNSDSDSEEKKLDESPEKPVKKSVKAKSDNDNDAESEEEDNNESGNRRSTKGLRSDDFEPEDNGRVHGKYRGEEADSDVSDRRRRRRRSIGRFAFNRCA